MSRVNFSARACVAILLCVVTFSGCAHVVVPHASQASAETQPAGKSPVIIGMPQPSSDEAKVVIHQPGVDLSTTNIWLGVVLAVLLFLAK
ncbi:MAG: hypothetical protein HY273_05610 [Gammaproteobacteria bacterium]|nr:hypothetical protein [Gammaproteobacteria bacterium]